MVICEEKQDSGTQKGVAAGLTHYPHPHSRLYQLYGISYAQFRHQILAMLIDGPFGNEELRCDLLIA
jgi:hypothetical protein